MTPQTYLETICRPACADFFAEPTSLRKAWAAATALFHFEDCVAVDSGTDIKTLRREMEKEFFRLSALADVANVSKHFCLERGKRKGLAVDDFRTGRGAAFSDGAYYSDGTSHSDAPIVVVVEFNGQKIDVQNLCREALTYFESRWIGDNE